MNISINTKGENFAIIDCTYDIKYRGFSHSVFDKLFFWKNKCICMCESLSGSENYCKNGAYVTLYKNGLKLESKEKLFDFINEYSEFYVKTIKDVFDFKKGGFIRVVESFSISDYYSIFEDCDVYK